MRFAVVPVLGAAALALGLASPPPERSAIAGRFERDPEASRMAVDLHESLGVTVDVLPAETFDCGDFGQIRLVPALPAGGYRKNLRFAVDALAEYDAFFGDLHVTPHRVTFVYRAYLRTLRFYLSVGDTMPLGFSRKDTIALNVNSANVTSPQSVRQTLFHEIFLLDQPWHPRWSADNLGQIYSDIRRRCGTDRACLAPYGASSFTVLRDGTYWAFHSSDDPSEYAAEVAVRWYLEQYALLRHEPPLAPAFKCGPEQNRLAWDAIVEEFFGGFDLVPACRGPQ
jgi:hypothetical protein